MSGKPSRDKGARYELHVARQMGAIKVSKMYKPGPDLRWRDYYVECKKRASGFKTLYKWLGDDASIVVHAADRQPDLITMTLDTFLDIIEETYADT